MAPTSQVSPHPISFPDPLWRVFSDRVMGGVSSGSTTVEHVLGREALRLRGTVSLENGGGFIQVVRSLVPPGGPAFDATAWDGVALDIAILAPGPYALHLRTTRTRAPWQFFAAPLPEAEGWQRVFLPWSAFAPRSLRVPLDPVGLRRVGLVATGAAFEADLALASLAFSSGPPGSGVT
ncbi:MAG: CIA30 family protein [Gemmatimonadales bacterium]|nr:MAG: CIA30 family protein [Gemmatimonadales bacterium]